MKYLVLFCFSVMFFSATPQAISASPPEAPEGFDYKIPHTSTWVNVLGENGIKKKIRSMIINMQNKGYSRSDLDVMAVCQNSENGLYMDIDQMVRDGQWFKLTRITFRTCGSMNNVLFKVLPIKKGSLENN